RRSFAEYVNFMRKLKCPVYMQKRFKYIPRSVPFPKDKLVAEFGRCFTSTASFLVALAIMEGYKVIGLWGVNPVGKDYSQQRPALEYLLSVAHQRGIRLRFPEGVHFHISKPPKTYFTPVLYAYEWKSPGAWWRRRVRARAYRLGRYRAAVGGGPAVSVGCGTGRPSAVSGPWGRGPPAGTGRPSVAGVQYGTRPPPAMARRRIGDGPEARPPGAGLAGAAGAKGGATHRWE